MSNGLAILWHRPRVTEPAPNPRRDRLIVGAVVAGALLEGALRQDLTWPVASTAAAACALAALLWRRTHPLAATIAAAVVLNGLELAHLVAGLPTQGMGTTVALLALPYTLFRWGSGRDAIVGSAVLLVGTAITLVTHRSGIADVVAGLAVFALAAATGEALRARAAARTRELERARTGEREQIARDLHDTVAHHVSAIAVRAQAGRLSSDDPAAQAALAVIESEARDALGEMRAVVRALRDDDGPATRRPGTVLDDLRGLVGPGPPPVTVTVDPVLGPPAPATTAALYRIAQEAVTNARRHARDATGIAVTLTAEDAVVHLRVRDDGAGAQTREPGFGLLGMAERADLLGGVCTAGPDPDGGWLVAATLPRTGA
ncbi:histidine kinase [Georgenia halophila]|uniref:histidine kinase n=1 Tax=Georgenia halophila TaxID=620889 RepID=A0ABP8LMH3_9MICO